MAWFRIDDEFHSNKKVVRAGNAATGLWARCGSWSADEGTEGHIPVELARSYGTRGEIRKLVDVGLFVEKPDGYWIPDYLEFNPSNEEVEALRAKRSDAGKRGGTLGNHRRHHVAKGVINPNCPFCRSANADTRAEANPEASASANHRPDPGPDPNSDLHTQTTDDLRVPDTGSSSWSDEYRQALDLVAMCACADRQDLRSPRAFRRTVIDNVDDEHGHLIRARLDQGDSPEQSIEHVLGIDRFTLANARRPAS